MAASSMPRAQKALCVNAECKYEVDHGRAVAALTPSSVIVRVVAVAINPADAKMLDFSAAVGSIGGYDFAGHVVAVGADVATPLKVGDRVCGFAFGNNAGDVDSGAFCEYVRVDGRYVLKVPDGMRLEEAAGLSVAIATTGLALYHSLALPMPSVLTHAAATTSRKQHVLVHGGSTTCGTVAIQLLRLSGFNVVATCSPSNNALVMKKGAEKCFDYRSPTCSQDIRDYTNDELAFALDCITDPTTMKLCYEAIGKNGGKYTGLEPFPMRMHTRDDIKPHWVLVLTMFGQELKLKGPYRRKVRLQDVAFSTQWFRHAQVLLDQGLLEPHPTSVIPGGLEEVVKGIEEIKLGKISGRKLVYTL